MEIPKAVELSQDVALPVLNFRDLIVERAEGSYVWDTLGKRYLDLNSGQYCSVFGHSDKGLAELFTRIMSNAQDTDTSTLSRSAILGLESLASIVPEMASAKGILLSTGGEANEFALKYAKHLAERPGVLSFENGYHGLSHGVAAYSMSRERIRPPLPYSYTVPSPFIDGGVTGVNDEASISALVEVVTSNWRNIAAMIFEPVISGGGVIAPSSEFFATARQLCDKYGIFLVFDECQTGMGRLGNWFGFQSLGVVPDILVTSKALGAGFPVAAVLMPGSIVPRDGFKMQYFSSHQNEAYAGEIVAWVIDRIRRENLLSNVVDRGRELAQILSALSEKYPGVLVAPRGKGLLQGFDIGVGSSKHHGRTANDFVKIAEQNGLLLQDCNYGRTIRVLPNYLSSERELVEFEGLVEATLVKMIN